MKIEIGKTYNTTFGRVKILALAVVSTGFSLVGEYVSRSIGKVGEVGRWNHAGKNQNASYHDLLSEFKGPEYRWFNVYRGHMSGFVFSLEEANRVRSANRISCCRIDIETGVVTNEKI